MATDKIIIGHVILNGRYKDLVKRKLFKKTNHSL